VLGLRIAWLDVDRLYFENFAIKKCGDLGERLGGLKY